MSRKRPIPAPAQSPADSDDKRQAIVLRKFRGDLAHWIGSDRRIALRVMRLVEDILKNPFTGLGKPEPMKHEFAGKWSRRITEEDRLVYTVTHPAIYFSRARHHYDRR
jgi:toxin YoeB